MANIIDTINSLEDLRFLGNTPNVDIDNAEELLGLKFSSEYREYLLTFGAISAGSIELTGIAPSKRLSVVDKTCEVRSAFELPKDLYIIEDLCIENNYTLQSCSGEIYSFSPTQGCSKIFNSLSEYILSLK